MNKKSRPSSDMQYLCKQAKETIKEYVTEHLPEQYQVCLTALNAIIKRTFDIMRPRLVIEKSCRTTNQVF